MIAQLLKKKPGYATFIWIALCSIAVGKFASISQNRTFQYDEWNFVMNRWQFNPDTFLQPHNSHLSIFPASVFFFLLRAVGLANYWVFLFVGFMTHIATASIFAMLVSRRLGKTSALALGALFLFLGAGA